MMPPNDSHATCAGAYTAGGGGTPVCALTTAPVNGMKDWVCIVGCQGSCPGGLVCDMPQGAAAGICVEP